jgi:tetratricopeptide (TPR) repeat protein
LKDWPFARRRHPSFLRASPRDAGRQLDVDYILEGSVLRAGQKLRINVQFIRVRDDFPLWSGKYDQELTDVFAIQEEISRGIVNSLRLKLGRGRRRYETSSEAYDLYLRARTLAHGQDAQIATFEQATIKDSSFAPAYSGLAAALAFRSGFDVFDPAERADQVSKMRTAAQKAIQLDPLLAEAHGALAIMHARDANWEKSERSFRRALELEPGSSWPHSEFARYLLVPVGRFGEALAQAHIAERMDPSSAEVRYVLTLSLGAAGQVDELDALCLKLISGGQSNGCLTGLRLRQGRFDEAVRMEEARWLGHLLDPGAGSLGVTYARAGRRDEAERIAATVPRPQAKASVYAALGDRDRTIEALEQMSPLGPLRVGWTLASPTFNFVRADPRIKALRKKVGLPE